MVRQKQLDITTIKNDQNLEYVEVAHPYHPLMGQKFKILKTYKNGGQEIFSLHNPTSGNFSIPRDWTDRAFPEESKEFPVILSCSSLLEIVDLVLHLDEKLKRKPKEEIDR